MSEVLATAGSKRNSIVISLNEYKGKRTLDIRNFFTNDKGDLCPTRKGISLSKNKYDICATTIDKFKDRINEWLSEMDKIDPMIVNHKEKEMHCASEAKYSAYDYSIKKDKWKSNEFFSVDAEGGHDKLTLNGKHPVNIILGDILKSIDTNSEDDPQKETSKKIVRIIEFILISYMKARHLSEGPSGHDHETHFNTLENNWGIFLDKYIRKNIGSVDDI